MFLFAFLIGKGQQPPVYIVDNFGNIYSINLSNCSSRLVCKTYPFSDIAFTSDGKLWGINGNLNLIDTTTGSYTNIGFSTGTGGESLIGLNDSILLSDNKDSLYEINVRNGKSHSIGYIGYYSCGDLTWLGGDLYMNTCYQLIKIVLTNTYTSIVSSTSVNSIENPIPAGDGLATVSFNGSDSIVIFGGPIVVNQVSGIYDQICKSRLPMAALGAASMTFPSLLPIQLQNFTYAIIKKTVQLQWQTTTEINSNYFSIERSADGVNFSSIGKVDATGNSNRLQDYAFVDNNPKNTNYYRLKEVDFDGKYIYSKILQVKFPSLQSLSIISNPVQNLLQLQINSSSSQTSYLTIFDFTGRRLKTFNAQNGNQNIDVSFLTSGTYFLQLITSDGDVYDNVFIKKR